jgi:hypothetical protein
MFKEVFIYDLCQSKFVVRIPNWLYLEMDVKLDVWQLIRFINEEGGVKKRTGFDAPSSKLINLIF